MYHFSILVILFLKNYLMLEWLNSTTVIALIAVKDTEQQETPFIAGGNAKCYSHFRRRFGNFLQSKFALTI